jgi:hypothetical protein
LCAFSDILFVVVVVKWADIIPHNCPKLNYKHAPCCATSGTVHCSLLFGVLVVAPVLSVSSSPLFLVAAPGVLVVVVLAGVAVLAAASAAVAACLFVLSASSVLLQ